MDILRLRSSIEDLRSMNLWISLVAEFLGTFILVYFGSLSIFPGATHLSIGVGFGLGAAVAIYCICSISGGNINPAVSIGLLVARQISLVRFLLYTLTQILGACTSAKLTTPRLNSNGTSLSIETLSNRQILFYEMVFTYILVFTVMRMCVEKIRTKHERALAPLIIGISIMLGVATGNRLGSGGMNPAAHIGLSGLKYYGMKIVGPMIGGTLAGLSQQLVFTSELSPDHIKNYLFSCTFDAKVSEDNEQEQLQSLETAH